MYISVLFLSYFIVDNIKLLIIKKRYISNNNLDFSYQKRKSKIRTIIYRIPIFEKIDIVLERLNNPYGLNIEKYLIIKFFLFIFFFIQTFLQSQSIIFSIIMALISFMLVDLLIYLYKNNQKKEIEKDLLNIVDNIYLQISSNIKIDKVLKSIYKDCTNKNLKNSFISLSNAYEYTGYNIQEAVKKIKYKFDTIEIEMLCNSLVEQIMLGQNLMSFENLSNILREKYIDNLKKSTNKKVILITISIAITLLNISLIVFYPILKSFNEGFNSIFS